MFEFDDDRDRSSHPEGPGETLRAGQAVEIGRLLRALLRRRWLVMGAAVVGIVAGALVGVLLVPRIFATQAVLVWETADDGQPPDVRELRTRVDSVKLPANLLKVREGLGLDTTLDRLAARLDVRFDRDSNLVTVRAEAESPDEAVALAEATVATFLAHQREIERQRLQEDLDTLRADLDRARERLGSAQERYDEFRREHGVADLSVERQQAIELAASLRAQADIARADAQAADARSTAQGVTEQAVPQESHPLRDARSRLETARARLSENHPRVQALAAEVAALDAAEPAPERRSAGTSAAAGERAAARRRQESYERLEAEARGRLTQLSSVEGDASALLATVRVAEGRVADVQAKLAEVQDAVRAASPGFRVVNPALMPEEPQRSYRRPAALAVPIATVVLTILLIFVRELWGFRVKTAKELLYWGKASVVASTTWPDEARPLAAVIDELGEAADRAGGRTLVISAQEADAEVAADVADHLRVQVTVRAANGGDVRHDSTFYDTSPYGPDAPLVTAPPDDGSGQAVAVLPADAGERDGGTATLARAWAASSRNADGGEARLPTLATREERTIARRRGGRLQQVHLTRDEIVMDDEDSRPPVSITTQEAGSGDAFVRRTARAADRVLVVVRSGTISMARAAELRALVGRDDAGVGFFLVGVPAWLGALADRAGPVAAFWRTRRDD